ncbi:hypothetical protein [Mycobacterium terramassiliense]|uniref:Uncharacterized protein n=1 Tax=Mycobacterium terramassiliense TaxID=1841859 RepID=A0A2U3NJA3_9MYCO|nr:hypothetical protein [Mycobacterium terramassiliense]SPM31570.1 hypothetical protein BN1232_02236 [Mycobacterium terramassiliense]
MSNDDQPIVLNTEMVSYHPALLGNKPVLAVHWHTTNLGGTTFVTLQTPIQARAMARSLIAYADAVSEYEGGNAAHETIPGEITMPGYL